MYNANFQFVQNGFITESYFLDMIINISRPLFRLIRLSLNVNISSCMYNFPVYLDIITRIFIDIYIHRIYRYNNSDFYREHIIME